MLLDCLFNEKSISQPATSALLTPLENWEDQHYLIAATPSKTKKKEVYILW